MSQPAAYTKGADALGRSKSKYQHRSITMKIEAFDQMIRQVKKTG